MGTMSILHGKTVLTIKMIIYVCVCLCKITKFYILKIYPVYEISALLFSVVIYCVCCRYTGIVRVVLPGLWIRSRSFTERALTTPPT